MKSILMALALGLMVGPVWAAAPACQPGFLATPLVTPSFLGDLDLGVPQPSNATGCTATNNHCPTHGGGTMSISCVGSASCSVGTYSITCDGNTHFCDCVTCNFCLCECYQGGGTVIQCNRQCGSC